MSRPASARAVGRTARSPLSYAIVLFSGMVSGFLVAEYGDVLLRYPVESVLVAGLLAGVLTLGWAGRRRECSLSPCAYLVMFLTELFGPTVRSPRGPLLRLPPQPVPSRLMRPPC